MSDLKKLRELEEKTGYRFKNFEWLCMAMRHSSYVNEHHMGRLDCNERLEFLGDAVLELVSSEFLYRNYPELPEGELTKLRASLVCEPTLAMDARALDLGEYLLLGKGEEATGGRRRDSIVSDAMEATIGAVFMDGGFEEARNFVRRFRTSRCSRTAKRFCRRWFRRNSREKFPTGFWKRQVRTTIKASGPRWLWEIALWEREPAEPKRRRNSRRPTTPSAG